MTSTVVELDTAASAVMQQLSVAKTALKNARVAATTVHEIAERAEDLPRIGTLSAIGKLANEVAKSLDVDGLDGWIEDAEELVALVNLIVNDTSERSAA